MASPIVHHEKYREEFSMKVAVVCDITRSGMTVLYHDVSLDRSIARSVALNAEINTENACAEISRFIFMSMREFGIPASAVKMIGCAAPVDISDILESSLDPTEMFLPPDVGITVIPFISAYADGRYTASLMAAPLDNGTMFVHFGKTLNLSFFKQGRLQLASVSMVGAFDGSALESGMPCEFGAIDEIYREKDRTLCYSVIGDEDSVGIAPSAAFDAITVMVAEGIIDSDGIMTDRDLFYVGEDYYISQKDVRAIQSDIAKAKAAFECFLKKFDNPSAIRFTGEAFAGNGMKRLMELGVIPSEIADIAGYSRSTVEQGVIAYLTDTEKQELLEAVICSAEDITDSISDDIEELYITNLSF